MLLPVTEEILILANALLNGGAFVMLRRTLVELKKLVYIQRAMELAREADAKQFG